MAASASLKIVIISSSERPCSDGCSTKSQSPERISRTMFGYFAVRTTTGFMGRHYTSPHDRDPRPALSTHRNDHPSDRTAHRPAERQRDDGSAPALHRRRDFSHRMADGGTAHVILSCEKKP